MCSLCLEISAVGHQFHERLIGVRRAPRAHGNRYVEHIAARRRPVTPHMPPIGIDLGPGDCLPRGLYHAPRIIASPSRARRA